MSGPASCLPQPGCLLVLVPSVSSREHMGISTGTRRRTLRKHASASPAARSAVERESTTSRAVCQQARDGFDRRETLLRLLSSWPRKPRPGFRGLAMECAPCTGTAGTEQLCLPSPRAAREQYNKPSPRCQCPVFYFPLGGPFIIVLGPGHDDVSERTPPPCAVSDGDVWTRGTS